MAYALRTRFKKEIIAEFLPPLRASKTERVIIFCPGQPGMPARSSLLEFWSKKGFWIFAFRYRGSWESEGKFLAKSPEQDVKDILDELPKGFTDIFSGKRMRIGKNARYYIFGNSFGGPAALLLSRDPRVAKVVATSPVVDWQFHIKHGETIDLTDKMTREGFGMAYRMAPDATKKLKSGKFYNPMRYAEEIDGTKVLIFHAKDDKIVPIGPTIKFAKRSGSTIVILKHGGHGSSSWATKPRIYKRIAAFISDKQYKNSDRPQE